MVAVEARAHPERAESLESVLDGLTPIFSAELGRKPGRHDFNGLDEGLAALRSESQRLRTRLYVRLSSVAVFAGRVAWMIGPIADQISHSTQEGAARHMNGQKPIGSPGPLSRRDRQRNANGVRMVRAAF
ncbi:MAG: hypothetical protein CL931_07150 [Deltaproteobacteria bacterium]|nr:hypothetical protein [Deltaproteobacteria bacterium]